MKGRYKEDPGTVEERRERAIDAGNKYRIKRGLINFIERLDCVADANLIADVASVVLRLRTK